MTSLCPNPFAWSQRVRPPIIQCRVSYCRWQLIDVAAGKVKSKPVQTASGFADVVEWTLATAASNHLTVLRSFGHGVDSSFPLQERPGKPCAYRTLTVCIHTVGWVQRIAVSATGKYNERAFQALDYILDQASKVGVRLILTMADNWSPVDSKSQVCVLMNALVCMTNHFPSIHIYLSQAQLVCPAVCAVEPNSPGFCAEHCDLRSTGGVRRAGRLLHRRHLPPDVQGPHGCHGQQKVRLAPALAVPQGIAVLCLVDGSK